MLNAGLIEELTATTVAGPAYVCHIGQDGEALALRATALALASVAEGAGAPIASLLIGTAGKAAVEVGVPAGVDPDGPPAALMSASEDNRGPDGPGRPGEAGRCGDTAAASCQAAEGAQKPAIAAEPAGRRIGLRRTAQAVLDTSVELAGAGRNVVDTLAAAIDGLVPR